MVLLAIRGQADSGKGLVARAIRQVSTRPVILLAFADPGKELGRFMLGGSHDSWYGSSHRRNDVIDLGADMPLRSFSREKMDSYLLKMGQEVLGSALDSELMRFVDTSREALQAFARGHQMHTSWPVQTSPREFLTTYCEALRETIPGIWTRALFLRYEQLGKTRLADKTPESDFIITDLRRVDEAEAVRAHGGAIWHVRYPEHAKQHRAYKPGPYQQHASETDYYAQSDALARLDSCTFDNTGTVEDLEKAARSEWQKLLKR